MSKTQREVDLEQKVAELEKGVDGLVALIAENTYATQFGKFMLDAMQSNFEAREALPQDTFDERDRDVRMADGYIEVWKKHRDKIQILEGMFVTARLLIKDAKFHLEGCDEMTSDDFEASREWSKRRSEFLQGFTTYEPIPADFCRG